MATNPEERDQEETEGGRHQQEKDDLVASVTNATNHGRLQENARLRPQQIRTSATSAGRMGTLHEPARQEYSIMLGHRVTFFLDSGAERTMSPPRSVPGAET